MSNHTPGPWWVDDDDCIAAGTADDYITIAEYVGPENKGPANKALLAAAPELLSSLEDGVVAAQAVIDSWESGNLARAVNDLRTWLALAEETLATAQPKPQ